MGSNTRLVLFSVNQPRTHSNRIQNRRAKYNGVAHTRYIILSVLPIAPVLGKHDKMYGVKHKQMNRDDGPHHGGTYSEYAMIAVFGIEAPLMVRVLKSVWNVRNGNRLTLVAIGGRGVRLALALVLKWRSWMRQELRLF